MAITHKIHSSRSNNNDSTEYIGEAGRVFYEQTTATGIAPTLRYSDGDTPGGLALSGASITVTGSAPLNPLEGNLWYDNNDGRLYVYYDTSWVDASPDIGTPIATTSTSGTVRVDGDTIVINNGVLSVNTSTLITNAVTVTAPAQPAITSVGTLTSLTVTNLVTAKNYAGQARDAGTLGAAGTLTVDFATDHNVLVNLTTTGVIGFINTSSGKTVTVLVKNATGNNRAVTLGVVAGNTSNGNASPNVNDGRTGVLVYRTFGTTITDVYCEFN